MKYPVKALVVYFVAMGILAIVNETMDIELNTLHLSICGLFMFGTSIAVHLFTIKASHQRPQLFPPYFMAITGIKMLVYIVALGFYVFVFQSEAIPMIVMFLTLYVTYTILEVISALKVLKNQK